MRRMLASLALFALVAAAPAAMAEEAPVAAEELAVAGPLGDRALGDPDAPVTVVEYASMTCSHCARFHNETFAAMKAKYIDTGKVRFVFREYPLDGLAAGAFMLARCVPEERYFEVVGRMFETQQEWAFGQDPAGALLRLFEPEGIDKAKFDACIADQPTLDHIVAVYERAQKTLGVSGTPTFFFNGRRSVGELSIDEVDAILGPML